jgi:GNAT superfamily N-acetyltransferase
MNIITKILTIALVTFATIQSATQAPENTRLKTEILGFFNEGDHFKICIEDIETSECYGEITYEIVRPPHAFIAFAYILRLHVHRSHRNKQYGGTLLKLALEKIRAEKIEKVYGIVEPSDLNDGETQEGMLPKLIKFYESHGAHITERYSDTSVGIVWDLPN